eukprot:scaffold32234_cov43-Prasinocladus_malaysianus.AAC.2
MRKQTSAWFVKIDAREPMVPPVLSTLSRPWMPFTPSEKPLRLSCRLAELVTICANARHKYSNQQVPSGYHLI